MTICSIKNEPKHQLPYLKGILNRYPSESFTLENQTEPHVQSGKKTIPNKEETYTYKN